MNIKAVVFDLDDTLYPEIDYVRSGFRAVGDVLKERFGIENGVSEMAELFDRGERDVFGCLLQRHGITSPLDYKDELLAIYRSHKPVLCLSDETRETLCSLRTNGFKLGIITDGTPERQWAKIDALRLRSLVDEIVITDELGGLSFRKPNPISFSVLCERMKIAPGQIAYVGDNPEKDFAIKKYLPIYTVQLLSTNGLYRRKPYLFGIEPDILIESITSIKDIVKSNDRLQWRLS